MRIDEVNKLRTGQIIAGLRYQANRQEQVAKNEIETVLYDKKSFFSNQTKKQKLPSFDNDFTTETLSYSDKFKESEILNGLSLKVPTLDEFF